MISKRERELMCVCESEKMFACMSEEDKRGARRRIRRKWRECVPGKSSLIHHRRSNNGTTIRRLGQMAELTRIFRVSMASSYLKREYMCVCMYCVRMVGISTIELFSSSQFHQQYLLRFLFST